MTAEELAIIIRVLKCETKAYGWNENGLYYLNTDIIPFFEKWLDHNRRGAVFIHNVRFNPETINGICTALHKTMVGEVPESIIEKIRQFMEQNKRPDAYRCYVANMDYVNNKVKTL